jgi:hypothetical protein
MRQTGEALAASRWQLLREGAVQLDIPVEAVSLKQLAGRWPGAVADRLQGFRARVLPLAAEVHKLNRTNAALLSYSLDFVSRLLLSITGGDLAGKRYGSAGGASQDAGCGSILSMQA